jgi:GxxExxY protein
MLSRVQSRLPEEMEALIYRTIGCCIAVHQALGPGLLESVYSRAVSIELKSEGLRFEAEKQVPVLYRGRLLCYQRLDLVVEGQLVVEIKAIERFNPVHQAQVLSYLRVTRLRVGLLMNFNVAVLQDGLKRIVL